MRYTLIADGGSDAVLMPILTWSLKRLNLSTVVAQWADFTRIRRQPDQESRIKIALDLYPCEILFVHRDAEGQSPQLRREEIVRVVGKFSARHVPVVPVRMTEAWLLASEAAIRCAAGNPNGKENLDLPEIKRLEDLPDPKRALHDALSTASGLNVRRRAALPLHQKVRRIPDYIDDFSCLNALPAFRMLQEDIRQAAVGL